MFEARRLQSIVSACSGSEGGAGADASRSRPARRAQGAFFTPLPLVDLVVDTALGALRERGGIDVDTVCIVDPACGDGRFLAAAETWLATNLGLCEPQRKRLRRRLVGIERDAEFARLARERLPGASIFCDDGLLGSSTPKRADVVVGNPPYVRSIRLGITDEALRSRMRGRFAATSHGEWDLYAAFLERAFDMVEGGGEVGFVVPSRWMTASFARVLRAKLSERRALRGVIDFGATQIFAGATTYASAVFLSGVPVERAHVARLRGHRWDQGTVAAKQLTEAPWRLSVGSAARSLRRLEAGRSRLSDLARIVKGAGTNCDAVFVFEDVNVRGRRARCLSRALGREVDLELAALRPLVRGRDVPAPGAALPPVWALVPYDASGALWSPDDLARELPMTWRYLSACRERLDARESGRFAGDRFYRYGRPQNLACLLSSVPRVIVPDVARGGRALADTLGRFALDSAYAVVPHRPIPLAALAAVLASAETLAWLSERGVLLRGGYVRMKTAFLRDLPVPPLAPIDAALRGGQPWQEAVSAAFA